MYLFLMIAFSFTERKATPHTARLKPWRHYARINSVIFSQNRFAQDKGARGSMAAPGGASVPPSWCGIATKNVRRIGGIFPFTLSKDSQGNADQTEPVQLRF